VLAVTSAGVTTSLLVRSVVAQDSSAVPEVRQYKIGFANDWAAEWAAGIGLKLSEEIAADAYLPQTAEMAPGQVLANLQQLAVTSLSDTALQVDTGMAPPAGGGFEVRLKDWDFGAGVDAADLVLRSPVRSFSVPRAAQVEQFYVRMYDGSTPPLYSRFSSAVFVNAPVS
jgi:cellobiose-specific phosphotransferase system component IIB